MEQAKKRLRQVADGATLQAVYSKGFYEAIGDKLRRDLIAVLDEVARRDAS